MVADVGPVFERDEAARANYAAFDNDGIVTEAKLTLTGRAWSRFFAVFVVILFIDDRTYW